MEATRMKLVDAVSVRHGRRRYDRIPLAFTEADGASSWMLDGFAGSGEMLVRFDVPRVAPRVEAAIPLRPRACSAHRTRRDERPGRLGSASASRPRIWG